MSTYLPDSEFGTPDIMSASSKIDDFAQKHGLTSPEVAALLADVTGDLFLDPQNIEANRIRGGKEMTTGGRVTRYGTPENNLATETLQSRSDQLRGAQRASRLGHDAVAAVLNSMVVSETPAVRLVSSEDSPGNETAQNPEINTPHAA